ncbi:late embryogenesis abundant protein At1g64065 [Lotus japonicus]|uniref:late embryogenesis abundant protein At1g64065 n=1 Tax=Lotus japonicus TaxID=34305 RepID=UPI00258564B4|nr:late embryogenesis abundant protein At1g64065 [Lotus japonicus]
MAHNIQTKNSWLRYHQETAMYKPVQQEKRSSKCFVFVFAFFVFCCAILLVFASILRVRNPQLKLRSATLNQISCINSSSFNATVITYHLSIKNPNYGGFSFENSRVSVLYAGIRVGERKIHGDRVNGRGSREMNVSVNVSFAKVPVTGNLSSDINSGTLNLRSYAKFSGTVHLLKMINRRKIVEMACSMDLNLTSKAIQGVQC